MVRPRPAQGFSLIELMIVLVIIGGMAAMVMPGLSEFLADARASSAAEDLVRLCRRTRARVQETGLAHLLQYDEGNDRLGAVTVWEGMNNHCMQTPWGYVIAQYANASAALKPSFAPFDMLGLSAQAYNPTSLGTMPAASDDNRYVIKLWAQQPAVGVPPDESVTRTASALTSVGICYQPNGQTFEVNGTTVSPHRLPFVFEVIRTMNGVWRGVSREVLVSPGGTARIRL